MYQLIIATPEHLIPGCIRIHHDGASVVELDILPKGKYGICPPENEFEESLLAAFSAYFSSSEQRFMLPIKQQGSDFQHRVWRALQQINAGTVMSYGELAKKLNSSARAIGNACRRNPVPIIVPCHRVVAKSGIGGFSGATQGQLIDQKRRLLAHEGVRL